MTPDSPYVSVQQAAKYASLSERTIRAALVRTTGDALPCRRVGRKILIRKSELDTWLDNFKIAGRPGVIAALKTVGLVAS